MLDYVKNNLSPVLTFGTMALAVVMLGVTVTGMASVNLDQSSASADAEVEKTHIATIEGDLFGTPDSLNGVVTVSSIYGDSNGTMVADNENTGHFFVTVPVSDLTETSVDIVVQSAACPDPQVVTVSILPELSAVHLPEAINTTCN